MSKDFAELKHVHRTIYDLLQSQITEESIALLDDFVSKYTTDDCDVMLGMGAIRSSYMARNVLPNWYINLGRYERMCIRNNVEDYEALLVGLPIKEARIALAQVEAQAPE